MNLENVRHIPQVMNGVVQQIAAKGFDRKLGPIAAKANPAPLGARHGIEAVGQHVARCCELATNCVCVLAVVALGNRGCVLIPVVECWLIEREHQIEAHVEKAKHVAHMAAVFEWRPHVGQWALANLWVKQHHFPLRCDVADDHADVAVGNGFGVKRAVGARALENPRPIFVVGRDAHALDDRAN